MSTPVNIILCLSLICVGMILLIQIERWVSKGDINAKGLASALDTSYANVSRWRSGKVYPSTEKIREIAHFLETTVEQLTKENKVNENYRAKQMGRIIKLLFMISPPIIMDTSRACRLL
jgi:transcriptional regulator with XRE-family HTH domain